MKQIIILITLLVQSAHAFEFQINFSNKVKGKNLETLNNAAELLRNKLSVIDWQKEIDKIESFTCLAPDPFDNSGVTSKHDLPHYLRGVSLEVNVTLYRPWNRNTIAKRVGNTISFAKRYMRREIEPIANTLFHELLHVAGFSHCGDNSNNELTRQSVPYVLGDLIENLRIINN